MDETTRSTRKAGTTDDTAGWSTGGGTTGDIGDTGASGTEAGKDRAKEWLTQLQAMIDNLATHAAPVMREVGAKAAELAALAGEKAGPIAHRAAEATEAAGQKVAERGRVVAAELRRDTAATETEPTSTSRRSGTAIAPPPADTSRTDVAGE